MFIPDRLLQPSLIFALRKAPPLDQTGKASQLKNYPVYLPIHNLRRKKFQNFGPGVIWQKKISTPNRQKSARAFVFLA